MQKKMLAAAIASAVCAVPIAAQAVSVKVSGHINRMIRWADDGEASDIQHLDHGGSRSRVRWSGSEKFGNSEAGVFLEFAVASNVSGLDDNIKNESKSDNFGLRHSTLWFGGPWGRVDAGLTTVAAGGYVDMTGTSAFQPTGINLVIDTPFRASADGSKTAFSSAKAFASYTFSRYNGIRYTSPKLGPVSFQVDSGNDESYGVSGHLSSSFGGAKVEAYLGYEDHENLEHFVHYNGSVGVKFSQGTSVSGGYAERDFKDGVNSNLDTNFWYAKVGHNWGNNTVSLMYYTSSDMIAKDDSGDEWSIAFMHYIPKPRVQLYASFTNLAYDHPTVDTEDINLFLVGSRIFF